MKKRILTIDLGASNGRSILFEYDGKALLPVSEHRFQNEIVLMNNTAYWDFPYLFQNVKDELGAAARKFSIDSCGIDAWGLDFGLVDAHSALMENPVSYRDRRTEGIPELTYKLISKQDLYAMTGTQFLQCNTVYQLFYLLKYKRDLIDRAKKILMIPDLLAFFLTGEISTEYTIASTMQLMNIQQRDWNRLLIERLGLPGYLLSDIVFPGEQAFQIKSEIIEELGITKIPFVKIASHDTASAVISIPASGPDNLYLSSGTWSILGTELEAPLIDEESYLDNFTNEGGFGGNIRYARSLMGLWLIQECVRNWKIENASIDYHQIDELVELAPSLNWLFDPQDDSLREKCHMPTRIAELCKKSNGTMPDKIGEFARCIYENMALNCRRAIEMLSNKTSKQYSRLYIVGGGSKIDFLNQSIANATGLVVEAGPSEATAYGNAFAQLYWSKEIASIGQFREAMSARTAIFTPEDEDRWADAYARFSSIPIQE